MKLIVLLLIRKIKRIKLETLLKIKAIKISKTQINIQLSIYNVNNNCATGSTAIHIANGLVAGGMNDCVLAVGFEKMEKGAMSLSL